MTLTEALKRIKTNWSKLPHEIKDGSEAVWIADYNAGSYEVDEEWIGMKGDGSLIWAYASGCSCWDGTYNSKPIPTLKSFQFNVKEMSKDWKNAIIRFAEDFKFINLPKNERQD